MDFQRKVFTFSEQTWKWSFGRPEKLWNGNQGLTVEGAATALSFPQPGDQIYLSPPRPAALYSHPQSPGLGVTHGEYGIELGRPSLQTWGLGSRREAGGECR